MTDAKANRESLAENLIIENLSKSYGAAQILHGLNLQVRAGEFISLLGPSGCGKTTTLRCIAGLERPNSTGGSIRLGDQTLSSNDAFVAPEKRGFGMVFQSYAVWPHMNVAENILFPLRVKKTPADEMERKLREVLALVHLENLENRFGHELSGGQQQRVALARALIVSPRLLLLDEPLSNLDALLREGLRAEIQRLQRTLKLTAILVTHDQKEALSMSDRIVLLNQGRIEAVGSPRDLHDNPPTPFAARFLLGAQTLKDKNGREETFLPRRWGVTTAKHGKPFSILSRLYLGHEFEYWAANDDWSEPIKFFSSESLELTQPIHLIYGPGPDLGPSGQVIDSSKE